MGRTVSALVTWDEECLGTVGPFAVSEPWWAEVEPVAERLRAALGVPVLVLRLLRAEGGEGARDGHVTYHVAALERPVHRPLAAGHADLAALLEPQELRAPWATLDGLRELLDWASRALKAAGRPLSGPAVQRKTWNLAALFRLPTGEGPVWLKATPAFAADEAAVIGALARADPTLVPPVIAAGPGRVLLGHLPGEDCWDASPPVIESALRRLAAAQATLASGQADSTGGIAGLPPGLPPELPEELPDRRAPVIAERVSALLDRLAGTGELTAGEAAAASGLLSRFPRLAECGLPDTVVHGDFHPGNWRGDGGPPALVDFADASLGNPVFDGLRARDFLPPGKRAVAARAWAGAWREALPGCDPDKALAIAGPLGHLVSALRYQEFLDGIEPSERVYHLGDPAASVRAALDSARNGNG